MLILESERLRAKINPKAGGRLASFTVDGLELLITDEGLPTLWGCYPMAPWAGRVDGGTFPWAGQHVELPKRLPPHALHGTVLDQAWTQSGPSSICTDFGPSWPWRGQLHSHFHLEDDLFEWTFRADGESSMPIILGWHPWFRRAVGGRNVELTFEPAAMYERRADGIPTGRLVEPIDPPWDDCFTDVERPPQLRWHPSWSLSIESTCDHWVLYTEPEHAICIEPQTGPPDAFNGDDPFILQEGEVLSATMRWRIHRDV